MAFVATEPNPVLVHEAIPAKLRHLGVEVVFGLMGDGNLRFVSQLRVNGLIYYGARHESCGVAMADGYARVTGRVAACTTTQGPGLTNAITALRTAANAQTPMVLLLGDTPRKAHRHIQDIDQTKLLEAAGAGVQAVSGPEAVASAIADAFMRAREERRPIGISIPTDLQDESIGPWPDVLAPRSTGRRNSATPSSIDAALDLLKQAERPVILAGRGAASPRARELLERLADRVGALLATTVLGKDLFRGNPYDIGIAGGFSTPAAAELLGRADLVMAFGASLNYWTTRSGTLFSPTAQMIQCDIDPEALGALMDVDCALMGDVTPVAGQLLEGLEEADPRAPSPGSLRSGFDRNKIPDSYEDQSTDETIDPRALCEQLEQMLPTDRLLAVDGGHFTGFPCALLSVPEPTSLLFGVTFGSIGQALGLGLGGAVGRPDHLAVAVVGDGGLMTDLGDLETAVRYRIPILVLVINDSAYGAELHHLTLLGLPTEEARFEDVDFAATARALGAQAMTVSSLDELEGLSSWLQARDGPLLLDCKVNPEVRAPWLEKAVAGA